MKLLFDQNLSPKLAVRLQSSYPGSSHVTVHSLDRATDLKVCQFARENGFTLVTKDTDFHEMAALIGVPPKVVWIRTGNCTTLQVEELLQRQKDVLTHFEQDDSSSILELL